LWENSLVQLWNSIHVAKNNFQVTFQSVENEGNTMKSQCCFAFMNFHLTTAKTDCRNEYTTSKLWEDSLFDFHNIIHVATNNFQVTFESVEHERNTMKTTVFDELPLNLY